MAKREKFTTLTSLHAERYGGWAGRPDGVRPDPDRCCVEVTTAQGRWHSQQQCSRPRGHGTEQAYCKQHVPEVARKRREEAETREAEAFRKRVLEMGGPRFFRVLCQIADGHNDPRALAAEAVATYRKGDSDG